MVVNSAYKLELDWFGSNPRLDTSVSPRLSYISPVNTTKNKQVGLYQTKKLLHSKRNYKQNEKATFWMGQNICKSYIW